MLIHVEAVNGAARFENTADTTPEVMWDYITTIAQIIGPGTVIRWWNHNPIHIVDGQRVVKGEHFTYMWDGTQVLDC